MPSQRIMVIRHGEKPSDDGSVRGVDLAGSPDSNELSVRGWQRAGALVGFFAARSNAEQLSPIEEPLFLFAPGATEKAPSVRAEHTLVPLAERLGKPIATEFSKGDEVALVSAISKLSGPVLVAWEHKAIVDIGNALMGASDRTPQSWPEDRFDIVWVFDREGSSWRFRQVPQLLLAGDRPDPI